MIRRRLSPAVLAALTLTCLLLLRAPLEGRAWFSLLLSAGAFSAAIAAFHCPDRRARRVSVLAAGLAAGALLAYPGLLRMAWDAEASSLGMPAGQVTEIRGVLASDSTLSRKGDTVLSLSLRGAVSSFLSLSATAQGRVLVLVTGNYPFSAGSLLSVRCSPKPFASAGPEAWIAYAGRADVRMGGYDGAFWAARAGIREGVSRTLSRAGYPASALLEALLIGAREDVPQDLADGFLKSGSLHVLALSGMHAGILAALVTGLLFFLPWKTVRFLAAAALLVAFQILAGWLPSLLRATSMFLIGGAAALLDRDAEPLNLLALSALPILLLNPYDASSLSFQLSYLALAGIFLVTPLAGRPLSGLVPGFLLSPVALSLGALAATTPLLLASTGSFYPSGILAGLVLVPLTTAFLWAGLAFLAAAAVGWGWLMTALSAVLSWLYGATAACARFFSAFPSLTAEGAGLRAAAAVTGLAAAGIVLFLPIRAREGKRT